MTDPMTPLDFVTPPFAEPIDDPDAFVTRGEMASMLLAAVTRAMEPVVMMVSAAIGEEEPRVPAEPLAPSAPAPAPLRKMQSGSGGVIVYPIMGGGEVHILTDDSGGVIVMIVDRDGIAKQYIQKTEPEPEPVIISAEQRNRVLSVFKRIERDELTGDGGKDAMYAALITFCAFLPFPVELEFAEK